MRRRDEDGSVINQIRRQGEEEEEEDKESASIRNREMKLVLTQKQRLMSAHLDHHGNISCRHEVMFLFSMNSNISSDFRT